MYNLTLKNKIMADCYFHGYSGGPGGCSECEQERREGLEQGALTVEPDISKARVEMGDRDHKIWSRKQEKNKKD